MPRIDVTTLLTPVAQDPPCGPNLEYDSSFGELERAAQGTPERVSGNKTIPAEDPNWNDVVDRALALLNRTKDLRVAVHLLHGALRIGGLPELPSGLALLRRLLHEHWDAVHPQLDREDGNDPTLRMNTLISLNDRAGVVGSLSRCTLVHSKKLGRVTLRDVRIATGEIAKPADAPSLDPGHVSAAFLDGELAELQTNAEAVRTALGEIEALDAQLRERVGLEKTPDLGIVTAELRAISGVLSEQIGRRRGSTGDVVGLASFGDGSAGDGSSGDGIVGTAVGDIRSRDDVIRVLDRICEYFQRNEPSSPIPLLLKRARRLVAKDFMDILSDLTPDAVSQAKVIVGLDKKQD